MKIETAEAIEIEHWLRSETERPGSFAIENLINKITDAPVLLERLAPHMDALGRAAAVLELGAGQGWASCLLKALSPRIPLVVSSDISVHALRSVAMWEGIFRTRICGSSACRSYQLPFQDNSFDFIFAFQAAHHFRRHSATLAEVFRVLRPGGLVLFMHEPTCSRLMYPLAVHRVRAGRPEVPEDVLLHSQVLREARATGFEARVRADCSLQKRGFVELVYYFCLRCIPPLQWLLPCTRDFVLSKPVTGSSAR